MKRNSPHRDVEFVCLDCSLPICAEKAKGCLYTIQKTAPSRLEKQRRQKARQTVDERILREADEIKTGMVMILANLSAQRAAGEFR